MKKYEPLTFMIKIQSICFTLIFRLPRKWRILFFRLFPEEWHVRYLFKKKLGYPLNLENPVTFNEKIRAINFHDKNPKYTLYADKLAVRDCIKQKIGEEYLIPLVFHTDNPKDLKPENIPNFPCIIKANHNSGLREIIYDKSSVNWEKLQIKFRRILKINYGYGKREWQYINIKPCILVEKLLLDENKNIPSDYRLFVSNGVVKFIQVDRNFFTDHKRNLYDLDWKPIDVCLKVKRGEPVEKPHNLKQLINLAQIIGEEFLFVRVDLYNVAGKIYFGECTFTPQAGFMHFSPTSYDEILGRQITFDRNLIR